MFGQFDRIVDGKLITRGSFSKFKKSISPVWREDRVLIRTKFSSESYFRGFIKSIESVIEAELIASGYIAIYDGYNMPY